MPSRSHTVSLSFQSVKILKERQMPPHWMFAFDDFLKATIKHSIEFLTPELRSDDSIDDDLLPPVLHASVSMANGDMSDGASISKYRRVSLSAINSWLNLEMNRNSLRWKL